jgi:hypothetical protein
MPFEQYFRLWLLLRHMRDERDRAAQLQELRDYVNAEGRES